MGTDRSEYVRQPCPCGGGEIVINHAPPDHPFCAGKFSWELWIQCDECSKQYALIHQDKCAVLVRREEIEQRETKNNAILKRERELEQSDRVQCYIRQFAELIANQDTEKRKFRYAPYCSAFGLGRRISKDLSVAEIIDLIRPTFKLREVASLLKQIGVEDRELVDELATNAREYMGWGIPYEVAGEPIAELTLKAFYGAEHQG